MRKNIRQKEVKPKEEIIEQSKEEVDRIQNMYNSLLFEFNKSHENETAILSLCSEILTTVKQLVVNGNTTDEIVNSIDAGVESLKNLSIKDECEIIHNLQLSAVIFDDRVLQYATKKCIVIPDNKSWVIPRHIIDEHSTNIMRWLNELT